MTLQHIFPSKGKLHSLSMLLPSSLSNILEMTKTAELSICTLVLRCYPKGSPPIHMDRADSLFRVVNPPDSNSTPAFAGKVVQDLRIAWRLGTGNLTNLQVFCWIHREREKQKVKKNQGKMLCLRVSVLGLPQKMATPNTPPIILIIKKSYPTTPKRNEKGDYDYTPEI